MPTFNRFNYGSHVTYQIVSYAFAEGRTIVNLTPDEAYELLDWLTQQKEQIYKDAHAHDGEPQTRMYDIDAEIDGAEPTTIYQKVTIKATNEQDALFYARNALEQSYSETAPQGAHINVSLTITGSDLHTTDGLKAIWFSGN